MSDALPSLEVTCFGPPTVLVNGREPPPDVLWRKNVALLVYLASSPNYTRSREHLLGLLWPEKDETRARHSLNEAVRRLRAALGADRIVSKGGVITLCGTDLVIDADAPEGTLPGGEFLEGLTLADAPAFEDWVSTERARHRDKAVADHLARGERALAGSRFAHALEAARRVLGLDPYAEPAARLLMRAATLAGDAAGALRAYHEFADRLAEDFDEKPSRELAALADRIRGERWRRVSAAQADTEPPLVGRTATYEEVFTLLTEAQSRGARTLVVAGEPGSGRSRLLTECMNRWTLEGGLVALARPLEGDRHTRWSGLRQLLRGGLVDAPGLAGTDPAALSVLAGVAPELEARFEPREALDHAHVATVLAALLQAVADESPLALVFDDAEYADDATLEAVAAGVAAVPHLPVLFAVSAPAGASEGSDELTRLQSAVGRRLKGAVVRLAPLEAEPLAELVTTLAPWCGSTDQRARLARRIMFETSGNPFLAVTLLRGLEQVASLRDGATAWPPPRETLESPVPIDVPHLVRTVTIERVNQLDPTARTVLVHAGLGDRTIDVGTVQALTGLSAEEVQAGLATLERAHFVMFDEERYMLEAPIIMQVIVAEFLTAGERKHLQAQYGALRSGRSATPE